MSLEYFLNAQFKKNKSLLLGATPGFRLQVLQKGRLRADLSFGDAYRFYDLASLTKIMFTASVFMRLTDLKAIRVDEKVKTYWAPWRHSRTTLSQLMTHSAGLPWWSAYYKKISRQKSHVQKFEQLKRLLLKVDPEKRKAAIYSDLDIFVLGAVMTEVMQDDLLSIWQSQPQFGSLHFNVDNKPKYSRRLYAPTEKCPSRKKVMVGEVHDENTWSLGGVAPHAGLFGTAGDVALWAGALRSAVRGEKNELASEKTAKLFTGRRIDKSRGDWGYVFMKPTAGHASCGKHFSLRSFGHTGFTGTSLWMDPVKDLTVILLTNRVHPTRENNEIRKIRPLIHDWVCEGI